MYCSFMTLTAACYSLDKLYRPMYDLSFIKTWSDDPVSANDFMQPFELDDHCIDNDMSSEDGMYLYECFDETLQFYIIYH